MCASRPSQTHWEATAHHRHAPPTHHPSPLSRPALQVEEEAIDLTCKPEFTEVNEGTTALRMLLLVEQT